MLEEMMLSPAEFDDFLEEAPTHVMIRRLIEEALAEAQPGVDEICEEDFDPETFCAIGTR